ncbi:hypothetical protein [Bacillus cereus]|uniref:hypothetical protein n=1 Tax=Bacillus cereus TaxID=1396 RepID=UPI001879E3FF|nr:hypothetical protein [Bacillus cereus]MBE7096536.1 hypothetical protein [Bacillus cereus]
MAKKKRHFTKQLEVKVVGKVIEIHKQPTLQETWDVGCEHLAVEYRKGNITWFADVVDSIGDVSLKDAHQRVLVTSSKNYKKALWGE